MGKTLPKAELIKIIAGVSKTDRATVERVLDVTAECIRRGIWEGQTVALPGLGRFHLKTRPARTGRNIRTGETIEIAEKRVLAFRPSAAKA